MMEAALNTLNEKEAFQIVLNKLKEYRLFCGIYDAINGDEHFMYGVSTVMEAIANYAGDEQFKQMFIENMVRSNNKLEV